MNQIYFYFSKELIKRGEKIIFISMIVLNLIFLFFQLQVINILQIFDIKGIIIILFLPIIIFDIILFFNLKKQIKNFKESKITIYDDKIDKNFGLNIETLSFKDIINIKINKNKIENIRSLCLFSKKGKYLIYGFEKMDEIIELIKNRTNITEV